MGGKRNVPLNANYWSCYCCCLWRWWRRGCGSDSAYGDDVNQGIFLHSENVSGSLCGGYGSELQVVIR